MKGLLKTQVHFLYPNGLIETSKLVKERDRNLKCNNRTIVKDTSHAYIDEKGNRHYYVNGHDSVTSVPYIKEMPTKEQKKKKILERESIHQVMQAKLIKSLVESNTLSNMTVLMLLIAGAGVGYVLGSEWGGDTYNNQQYDQTFETEDSPNNSSIVISSHKTIYDINEVFFWLNN